VLRASSRRILAISKILSDFCFSGLDLLFVPEYLEIVILDNEDEDNLERLLMLNAPKSTSPSRHQSLSITDATKSRDR
jgi:hypothetical protein